MTVDNEKRCGNCIFCDQQKEQDIFCRRYPPALVAVSDRIKLFYPSVSPEHDWCGEHKRFAN